MIEALKVNLEINNISDGFEIYNQSFEELNIDKVDLCVIDAFPGVNLDEIIKKAEIIADNVFII